MRTTVLSAAILFILALALRLLFWQATPDAAWGWSAAFKGDAPVWYAQVGEGASFEAGLPWRPPGGGALVGWAWSGAQGDFGAVRFLWCLLGATAVTLIYLAACRAVSPGVAAALGVLSAGHTGLIILGTSPNTETPYLALVALLLWMWPDLVASPQAGRLLLWGAIHAVACLLRAEHLLLAAAATALLALEWRRLPGRRTARRAALVGCAFALTLAPWHLHAWASVRRFNEAPLPLDAAAERAQRGVEAAVAHVDWSPEAAALRDGLPGCCRRTAAAFVAATVAVRGGARVDADDIAILDDAFGYVPHRLGRFPFIAVYGPLNFYLANHPAADGGFSRRPLEAPPPLAGGAGRYPLPLVAGLPPRDLTLTYPPHLRLVNDGYALGLKEILARPAEWLQLAGRKLMIFWRGAAMGQTGFGAPLGLSGERRRVDLVAPGRGAAAAVWRFAVAVLAVAGAVAAWPRRELRPWLLYPATVAVVSVAFFGYARQGAMAAPAVWLLAMVALERWLPGANKLLRRPLALVLAGAVVLLGAELARCAARPHMMLDGQSVGEAAPFPADEHRDRRLEVRFAVDR